MREFYRYFIRNNVYGKFSLMRGSKNVFYLSVSFTVTLRPSPCIMLGVNDLQHLPNVESLKAIKKIVLLFSALSKHPSKITLDFRHYKVMSL
jgi:hypothetical protein